MRLKALAVPTLATLALAGSLSAQDVQYKNVTSTDFGGPLGTMMKFAAKVGGGSGTIDQQTYIKGRKMRSDMMKTSSIIDLDAGKIISVNHDKKEYSELTFAEMREALSKATAQAQPQKKSNEPQPETKIDVKVDETSEKQTINGVDARRYFVTTTITVIPTEEQRRNGEKGGSLVLLNDMWMTKDAHYRATQKFNKEMADEMGDLSQRSVAILFGSYPQAKEGFKKAADEMAKMEGAAVRTTSYMVGLPENMKLDRDKLVGTGAAAAAPAAEPEKKKKGGFGGLLKAAQQAAASGGGGNQSDGSQQPEEQVMIFKMTSDISDVKTTSVDAALFAPPAGYKLVKAKN
jgi:hypothetical protein